MAVGALTSRVKQGDVRHLGVGFSGVKAVDKPRRRDRGNEGNKVRSFPLSL